MNMGVFHSTVNSHKDFGKGCPRCHASARLTWDEIIPLCVEKHNGLYVYYIEEQPTYKNNSTKMFVHCLTHGRFEVSVHSHKDSGSGCPLCANERTGVRCRLSWESVIRDCIIKHKGRYTYYIDEQEPYLGNTTPIAVHCDIHGLFHLATQNHKDSGQGCAECGTIRASEIMRQSWETIIPFCITKHNGRFKYYITEQPEYKNSHDTKMVVHCDIHGKFDVIVSSHKSGVGCMKCGGREKLTWDIIISDCVEKYSGFFKYDIDKQCVYKNTKTKMIVTCPLHGEFSVTVDGHRHGGVGCSTCNESYGERSIRLYLTKHNISHEQQYSYVDCRGDYKQLKFDFYLPDYDILIEYDGEQHFEYIEFIHETFEIFERQQRYDEIKNKYCKKKGIRLLRIPYFENIIETLECYLAKFL